MERKMQRKLFLTAIVAVLVDMSMSLAAAAAQLDTPKPPQVEILAIPAGQLYLGMAEQDVMRIMGRPAKVTNYVAGGIDKRKVEFQGLIPSMVMLSAGKLTGVALDVFQVAKTDLPSFSRKAWPGMGSAAVRGLLGKPSEICHHIFFGIKLDQWVYDGSGEPEVSLFFADDRVIAKTVGRGIPQDIFQVHLPSETQDETVSPEPRVGMAIDEIQKLYGDVKLHVNYVFNGRPTSRMIFEKRLKGSFTTFTFVDGRLIEFEDLGPLTDDVFRGL
jgi:hypothetical protein